MTEGFRVRTKRVYYVAGPDEVGRPHWASSIDGRMLYGFAEKELVDNVDWLTYKLVFDIGYRITAQKIREVEGPLVELEFVSRAILEKMARGYKT